MSRRRLLDARPKTENGALGALRRRARKKDKSIAVPEVIPFDEYSVVKETLKGPLYNEFRDGKHIHVSDLIYKCVRKIALSKTLNQPIDPEPLFDSPSLTFAQGHAMAEFIISKLTGKVPRNVYGTWTCRCGQASMKGTRHDTKNEKCGVCGHGLDAYVEIITICDELMVSGAIDLIIKEDGAYILVELKSIKKDAWDELERPVPDHLIQILFYWYLMQKAGMPLHDKVAILYACKDYMFANPYKEFVIQPSRELHRLDDYLEDAQALKAAIHDNGELPPRVTCPSQDSPAAKKCQFRDVCFQL